MFAEEDPRAETLYVIPQTVYMSAQRTGSMYSMDIHCVEVEDKAFESDTGKTSGLLHGRPRLSGTRSDHTWTADSRDGLASILLCCRLKQLSVVMSTCDAYFMMISVVVIRQK